MKTLQEYILKQLEEQHLDRDSAIEMLRSLRQAKLEPEKQAIAVIGMACRIPMADQPEAFWDNLVHGRNCFETKPLSKRRIEEVYRNLYYAELVEYEPTSDRNAKTENYIAPFIKDFDCFDARFFGIPPREASYMDPQHRVLMEVAWEAIENAGYGIKNIKDSNTGIFVGKDGTNTLNYKFVVMSDQTKATGNWDGILASRLNYHYNLLGPAMVIDTACSSGLVSIHQAIQSLRAGDCDTAIAAGVALIPSCNETFPEEESRFHDDGTSLSVSSSDNRVRSFDRKASGTVFGEGVVAFLLKPLEAAQRDGDVIHALIRGSAINSDGASNGITAPNPLAQEKVIVKAWEEAGVDPTTISYIETHGTGTLLGDPVEVLGITNAFRKHTSKRQFCGIGSVKTNIGHLIGASGCASLMKVILAMKYRTLPPSIYFEEPNPHINFIDSPVYVVDSLRKWENGSGPLRAGISSFGFSGTNAHLIVEEYIEETKTLTTSAQLLVLSALSKTALDNTVARFIDYLKKNADVSLADMAYTLATGRGDYPYRLAVVAENQASLLAAYEAYLCPDTPCGEEIIYRYAHIETVADRSHYTQSHQKKESEVRSLSREAAKAIAQDPLPLESLAELYVQGAKIPWELFPFGNSARRISLPTYAFDKTPYWGEPKRNTQALLTLEDPYQYPHPLVRSLILESMGQQVYRVMLNLKKDWVLQDHKIMGNHLISGTTYIEMLKEVLERKYGTRQVSIEDLVFLQPLIVREEDGDVEAHIVLAEEGEKVRMRVVSKVRDEMDEWIWVEHCRGTGGVHEQSAKRAPTFVALTETMRRQTLIDPSEMGVSGESTCFGPRWRCAKQVFETSIDGRDALVVEIELPEALRGDLKDGYAYHPGMLDDALNVGLQMHAGSKMYLPFTYKNLRVYHNLPSHFYSILYRKDFPEHSGMSGGEFLLADLDGRVLATIEECALKHVSVLDQYIRDEFYMVRWKKNDVERSPIDFMGRRVLLLGGREEIAQPLAERVAMLGAQLLRVRYGASFQKESDHSYIIGTCREDMERLIAQTGVPDHIYHLENTGDEALSADLDSALQKGVYSLWYLCDALMKKNARGISLTLVASFAAPVYEDQPVVVAPHHAFLSLAKTIIAEYPDWVTTCVDIDRMDESGVSLLCSEHKAFRLALREGSTYLEELQEVKVTDRKEKRIDIRPDGVYLITGGTGGIGREVAAHLSARQAGTICLTSRGGLLPESEWEKTLSENPDSKVSRLIQEIRRMRQQGTEVIVRRMDVSDAAEVSGVLEELRKNYGRINGIVHCAGVAGDGFLFKKTEKEFASVFAPKAAGIVCLDRASRGDELDFFVAFSSIQAFMGGPGQGDYTAANAFMDAYVDQMRREGRPAQSVNWPGWLETGMAFDRGITEGMSLFKLLKTDQALSRLDTIIRFQLHNLVPSAIEFAFLQEMTSQNLPYPLILAEPLQRRFERYRKVQSGGQQEADRNQLKPEDLVLFGKSEAEYTETEKKVAYIYAVALNIKEVNIYEDFASMGGNSIIATEVLRVLNREFDDALNVSDMFTYSCVEEISNYIDALRKDPVQQENSQQMVDKFDAGEIDVDSMIDFFEEE